MFAKKRRVLVEVEGNNPYDILDSLPFKIPNQDCGTATAYPTTSALGLPPTPPPVMPMDEPFLDNGGKVQSYGTLSPLRYLHLSPLRFLIFFLGLPIFFLRLAKRELWQ
jgi:hypothetical protein